jgi:hypothetical protein
MKLKNKFRDSKGVLHHPGADVSKLGEKDLEFLKKNGHVEEGKEKSTSDDGEGGGSGTNDSTTPATAKELIEKIAVAETVEDVDAIIGDDERATVIKAATARKAALNKAK